MSLTAYELQLNRAAQGMISWDETISWFEELQASEQQKVLNTLAAIAVQSHPLPDEAGHAVARAGLKPTFTPCVQLLKAKTPERACWAIADLPNNEWLKCFKLLLSLFSIADYRRRTTDCVDGCSHDWHHLS